MKHTLPDQKKKIVFSEKYSDKIGITAEGRRGFISAQEFQG
jgi:hypothetical protein